MSIGFLYKKKQAGILTIRQKGNKKYALIIYVPWAIKEWIGKTYTDEQFNGHSMHWESIEMVRALNNKGFDVDYIDCTKPVPAISWSKYELVIDERNNTAGIPVINGQQRIFYATGCHWMFHNLGEWERLYSFRQRYGIALTAERQVEPIPSEAVADRVTYFGGDFQKNLFTNPGKAFPLSLSSAIIPGFKEKEITGSRRNVLWLGSRGFIHKGLDIVLEAFKQQPQFNLHICTRLEAEPGFYNWFKQEFADCPNIFYHGWKEVTDPAFQALAENCIASVYCSAAEGGAGAIIQAMQFGCIPIVNDSTALRAQHTGFYLPGKSSLALVNSIREVLDAIASSGEQELIERSAVVRSYANKHHSRAAYSHSFNQLIDS